MDENKDDSVVVEYEAVEKLGEIVRAFGIYLASYIIFIIPVSFYGTLALMRALTGEGVEGVLSTFTPTMISLLLLAGLIGAAYVIKILDATGHEPPGVRVPRLGYLAGQLYAIGYLVGIIGLFMIASYTLDPSRIKGILGLGLVLLGVSVSLAASFLMGSFISKLEDMVSGVIETRSLGRMFMLQFLPVLGVILLGIGILGLYIEYSRLRVAFYSEAV